jgi:hypothetical protein
MARLKWRRQNLFTYRLAERARNRHSSIYAKLSRPPKWDMPLLFASYEEETRSPEELRALHKAADEEARTELGAAIELVEIGEVSTIDYLEKELSIIERLDAMIDRCLKSLLYVRGIKSMSSSSSSAASQPRLTRAA